MVMVLLPTFPSNHFWSKITPSSIFFAADVRAHALQIGRNVNGYPIIQDPIQENGDVQTENLNRFVLGRV